MQVPLGVGQSREWGRDDAAFAPAPKPLQHKGILSTSNLASKDQLAWALTRVHPDGSQCLTYGRPAFRAGYAGRWTTRGYPAAFVQVEPSAAHPVFWATGENA